MCIQMSLSVCVVSRLLIKKEPTGTAHKDGKHSDSCTLITWRGGKPLAWDVTVCTTASHAAGAVAEQPADRKCLKYTELSATCEFQPVAVETRATKCLICHVSRRPGPQDFWTYWRTAQSAIFIPADQCFDSKVQFSPLSWVFYSWGRSRHIAIPARF